MSQVLHGDASGNQINAIADRTQVYGLAGNDTLTSDGKSDVLLVGGSGDDSLIMSGGNGTLSGGKGADTFELTYSADKKISAVIDDLVPSEDKIIVNFDGNTAPQLTSITSGNDVVLRDGDGLLTVTLKGVRDNDYLDRNISNEAWKVLELTNAERENQNLSPLTASEGLTAGASIRAEEITSLGVLGLLTNHTRPEDKGNYDTVFKEVGKTYVHYAENLDGGAVTPEEVVEQWMSSDSHKENILNPIYQKLGVGYNYDDPDPTNHRYYWTQLFADSLNNPETVSTAELLTTRPQVNIVSKFITLTENPDTYSNTEYGATIEAKGGGDKITNTGLIASISGGADIDTITSSGSFVTINGGTGDDSISLSASAKENVIEYANGDGNDTIIGLNSSSTVSISGSVYTPVTVGNDVIVAIDTVAGYWYGDAIGNYREVSVGGDSITLADAASLSNINFDGRRSRIFILTEGDDSRGYAYYGATVQALGGNDRISNYSAYTSIDGGTGNDSIYNWYDFEPNNNVRIYGNDGNDYISNDVLTNNIALGGGSGDDTIRNSYNSENVSIYGGSGNDSISNGGVNVSIYGGDGDDTINNSSYAENVSIYSNDGNDSISNDGDSVIIDGGFDDDTIYNDDGKDVSIHGGYGNDSIYNRYGDSITIDGGLGADTIENFNGDNSSIVGGLGNDSIKNTFGNDVTIDGGGNNDTIDNLSDNVSINGGAGNDSISNGLADNVTISGGLDNDTIHLVGDNNRLIQYNEGDGKDTIEWFKVSDTLQIGGGSGTYSTQKSGSDIIVNVGTGSIRILSAATLSSVNIDGTLREMSEQSDTYITLTEDPDNYTNTLSNAIVFALGGDDSIDNESDNVTINGGVGNDSISNGNYYHRGRNNVTINGDDGNDLIDNSGDNVIINGGNGNDLIFSWDVNVTISGGLGNDTISLTMTEYGYSLIKYTSGDGNDVVRGFKATDRLSFADNKYTSSTVGNDVVFRVGTGSITLLNAASLPAVNVIVAQGGTNEENKLITLSEGDDTYDNNISGATIQALGGNDSISNTSSFVIIDGGNDNDIIDSRYGDSVTILGGAGNDSIYNNGNYNTIVGGDGNDTVYSWGNNVTINSGDGNDSITNAYGDSATIDAGDGSDRISNSCANSTINAGAGNDTISNTGSNVTIDGGDGNDSITTGYGDSITIDAGDGDDYILNLSNNNVTINAGNGNDDIFTRYDNVIVDGGNGDDTIKNWGDSVTIDAGDGNDRINNIRDSITLDGGAGSDRITNSGSDMTVTGGDGNDNILNLSNNNVTIEGGNDNDTIENQGGSNSSIVGGDGDDFIYNYDGYEIYASNATIDAGTGDDKISLSGEGSKSFINYMSGDGNDIIWGYNSNTTLNISGDKYTTQYSGDDIVYLVGNGSITLKDARDKPLPIIIGESGTSGGGSDGGSDGGSSSGGGGDGGGRGGNDGGNTSGGTSSNEGRGSDASGGRSAIGSAGRSSSTNTDTGGGAVRVTTSKGGGSRIAVATNISDFMIALTPATQQTTAQPTTNQRIYSGGNQIISDYTSDEKITFGEVYTGSFYDDAGNYCVGSSTGALVIQNAVDKVIDLSDAAGNSVIKAYAASSAGVIDGRGLSGFEIINGSAGADSIFAGDGGSQLWGGADYVQDIMVGGNGTDIFIGGRTQGADIFFNASSADIVHLNDATLSDIVATAEDNGAIAIAFNTGNVIGVQSSELLSSTFILADGSQYRYNYATKNWQTA